MASLGATSIARRRQAAKSPALTLPAIAAPLRPVSVANASSPRLEKAAKSPPLRLRTAPRAPRGANSARENQDRSRAFPIAANRPAPSFNPAYVRSPFVTPNPRARDLT